MTTNLLLLNSTLAISTSTNVAVAEMNQYHATDELDKFVWPRTEAYTSQKAIYLLNYQAAFYLH